MRRGGAQAFARHVVILDEPTAALGVKEGNMVLELIRRVRDKGLPVILARHNMPHVFEIADRIHIARLHRCAHTSKVSSPMPRRAASTHSRHWRRRSRWRTGSPAFGSTPGVRSRP